MYYNNSVGIEAQEEHRSEKNRDTAITLWVILCAILAVYIFPISEELFGGFGGALILMAIPIIMAIIVICSSVLYCRAHRNTKKKDELRTGSKVLLIMSLAMLIFIVGLWMKGVIEVNSYIAEHNLKGTSGVSGPWMSLLALVPISATSIIGFLSFLVGSITLKRWSRKY